MTTPNPAELKSHLLKLAGLAELESSLLKIKRQLEEIPQNLKELEDKYKERETQFEEKKTRLAQLEQEYRQKEAELTDSKEKIKTRETRLFEIKTTKEYQATLKEIATAKKQNLETENLLLQRMGEIETLKTELPPLEEEIKNLGDKINQEKGQISGELEGLQKQLEEKNAEKQQLFATLDSSLVSHYERILIRRQPAIAPVRYGTCQECNMNVPPQLFIELQKYREVIHCTSCNRILFIPSDS